MRLSKLPGGASKARYTKYYISTRLHVSSTEASDLFDFVRYCHVFHFLLRAVLCMHVVWPRYGIANGVYACGWPAARRVIGA